MNLDFLDSLEFQTFARLADNAIEISEVLNWLANKKSVVDPNLKNQTSENLNPNNLDKLKKLIQTAKIDYKLFQIELAKAKLAPEIREDRKSVV